MKLNEMPWIVLNAAMTADGKIDSAARQGAKISSDSDWDRVDQLRADVDAVMVGGNTLISEDPRLTVKSADLRDARRKAGRPANPAKVGIISQADLPIDGKFITDGDAKVFVFTTTRTGQDQIEALRAAGAEVIVSPGQRVDLHQAMAYLKDAGISRVLLEGGGTLNAAMLAEGLIDEIQLYIAPLIFGGAGAPTLADGPGISSQKAPRLTRESVEMLPDGGILVRYLVDKNN
jgi:2,5-diamino-6-(ribosylamino)-4(3H)-pyrimidinone 5'-phosphate reductase